MIKKLSLIIFLISISVFSQQDQKKNPNVELPDFVITGKDVISVQNSKKINPGYVSTLSEQFIKPAFSPEELPIKELENPLKHSINLFDSLNYKNGAFNFGAGLYKLPEAQLFYEGPIEQGIYNLEAGGIYQRAYDKNTDRYGMNGKANLAYFVDNDASFLPGTQLKLHGDYGLTAYKLFASQTPDTKRTKMLGSGSIEVLNNLNEAFNFGIRAKDNLMSIQEETFKENLLNLDAYAKLNLTTLQVGLGVNYKRQNLTNDIFPKSSFSYIALSPTIGMNIGDAVKAKFGFNYAKSDSQDFLSPMASISFKVDKGVSMFAEYSPKAEFYTAGKFLMKNDYFNTADFTNLFVSENSNFGITIKYEYLTYVEVDGGFKFFSSDELPYFASSAKSGKFDIKTTKARSGKAFLNLLFHAGPYGVLYGTVEYRDVRDTSSMMLPYSPQAFASVSYGYNFHNIGLDAEIGLKYNSSSYADLANTISVNSNVNLGMKFSYMFKPNFYFTLKFDNMLNHSNYEWFGYKQTPFDVTAGVRYLW